MSRDDMSERCRQSQLHMYVVCMSCDTFVGASDDDIHRPLAQRGGAPPRRNIMSDIIAIARRYASGSGARRDEQFHLAAIQTSFLSHDDMRRGIAQSAAQACDSFIPLQNTAGYRDCGI